MKDQECVNCGEISNFCEKYCPVCGDTRFIEVEDEEE